MMVSARCRAPAELSSSGLQPASVPFLCCSAADGDGSRQDGCDERDVELILEQPLQEKHLLFGLLVEEFLLVARLGQWFSTGLASNLSNLLNEKIVQFESETVE